MKKIVFCITLSFFAATVSAQKTNDSSTPSDQTILLKVSKTYTTPLLLSTDKENTSLKQLKKTSETNGDFKNLLINGFHIALKSTEEIIIKRKNKKLYS